MSQLGVPVEGVRDTVTAANGRGLTRDDGHGGRVATCMRIEEG
jgi:hypothetical protein